MDATWHEQLWPDPRIGPYRLRLWYGALGGRPAVLGLEMWGTDPAAVRPRRRPARPGTGWWDHTLGGAVDVVQPDGSIAAMARPAPPPDAPVTPSATRLPLARMLQQAIVMERARAKAAGPWLRATPAVAAALRESGGLAAVVDPLLAQLPKARRGRPPLAPERLRFIAEVYTEALSDARRDPAKVVQYRLSEVMGQDLKAATVRSWIKAARDRGFLAKPPARAGAAAPRTSAKRIIRRRAKL